MITTRERVMMRFGEERLKLDKFFRERKFTERIATYKCQLILEKVQIKVGQPKVFPTTSHTHRNEFTVEFDTRHRVYFGIKYPDDSGTDYINLTGEEL